MKVGKLVAGIMAVVLGLVAMAALVGGSALIWAHTTQRDADGFLESPTYDLVTAGYAITSGEIDLGARPGDWWPADLADVRFMRKPPTQHQRSSSVSGPPPPSTATSATFPVTK